MQPMLYCTFLYYEICFIKMCLKVCVNFSKQIVISKHFWTELLNYIIVIWNSAAFPVCLCLSGYVQVNTQ